MDTIIFLYDFQFVLAEVKNIKGYKKVLIVDKQRKNPATLANYGAYFDDFFEVENIFDVDVVANAINKIIKKEGAKIKAILATFEGVVEVAGALREMFHVDGMTALLSNTLRNKYLMKKAISGAGLPCAHIEEIFNTSDLAAFGTRYGFPLVVKPKTGFGTENTFIISSEESLAYYDDLLKTKPIEFVVESFIKGEEYHCDSIVIEGKVIFSSVGKYRNNGIDTVAHGKMDGTVVFPASDRGKVPEKIKQFNKSVINALGIQDSICHLEVFVNGDKEVYFGEIGARVPGGFIGKNIQNTHRINLFQVFIDLGMGKKNIAGQSTCCDFR